MTGLSCSIAALLGKLRSVLDSPSFTKEKSVSFLKRLESALKMVSDVIIDAEKQQLQLRIVKIWLQELEDAVYDAEDVVDEILYEATRRNLEAESQNFKSWARGSLLTSTKRNARRMKSIRKTVEVVYALAVKKYQFGFRRLETHNEMRLSELDSLPVSTSLLDETAIYGREEDRSDVVRLLLSGHENLAAIALVGEGGLGKTTLARLVYNDEKVRMHFEPKVWIGVGIDFDVHIITGKILAAVTFCSFKGYGLDELQEKLSASLAGKKFILVLDDVWNEDFSKWDALLSSLKSGARGSKIIVTARSVNVASVMGCSTPYYVHALTVEDCWSILESSAFAGRDRSDVENLKYIGRNIVEKCHGLPLSVRAIGGLLRFKKTSREWLFVLENLEKLKFESFRTKTGDSISPILWLSYYHLPAQLKRCFAYCSLFPKDYEFDMEELVLLWMAEGFLQPSTVQSEEKEVGAECFNGLLQRSFFTRGDSSRFKMHDLMHDLAEFVSEGVCFRLDSRLSNKITEPAIPGRTRHLSLLTSQHEKDKKLSFILEKRLRTIYLINCPSGHESCELSPEALQLIFARTVRLRVLSIPHFQYAELPASIGNLKCLRYLDVSDSTLKSLPESLCTLYCLQTLILTNCSSLRMLPQGIVKLVHLRTLHIKGAGLKQMPKEMDRLMYLRSLSNFVVGYDGSSIKELGALRYLHGSLSVSMLQNVSSASDAYAANLKNMRYLDELELDWSHKNEVSATNQEEVLENLEPSLELKKLSIRFYGGRRFPMWLGDSSILKITSLHLGDCYNCNSLPPLGQLSSLEHLIIEGFSGIRCIGLEFFGVDVSDSKPFQSLKTLKFGEMLQWQEWILPEAEGKEFPCLEEFYIVNCRILKGGLPKSLPTLRKLAIANCENLVASLPRSSEHCVLDLDTCYKEETQDKILSKSDGEVASQSSSSMTQIPGNEIQLERIGTMETPAEEKAEPEDQELSGKFEKPQSSSSMTQISGNELQLERIGTKENPAGERAVQEDLELSGTFEKPQSFSTMTQISGNEQQLERIGTKENSAEERTVQEDLELSEELEKPSIGSYGGQEFPKWLEISSLSKITFLYVSDNNNCSSLPPLGQLPFLEHLTFQRIRGVRSIGPEFYGLGLPFRKPFQSLQTLKFEAMSQWERWTPLEVDGEEFPCLQVFYIINCPKLEGDLPKALPSLIQLEISECQQLAALLPWTPEHCVLKLENCDKVQKRSKEFSPKIMQQVQDDDQTKPSSSEGNQQFSSSLSLNVSSVGMEQSIELPTDSHSLRIERYASDMLPKEILERSSLQHLYIIDCIPLKIFPLSPSLKTLYIHNCKSLEFPQPNKVMNQDVLLEDLCLGSSCDSLEIFPLNYFPKLKALSLWDCRNLECLSIKKELQTELTSLDALEIKDCPKLRSFLEEEFQAPNLTSLVFFNCGSLKSLQRMQSFKSLQSLYISKCPALVSLPVEGLPSGLVILCISFCDKITPQNGWKLDKLHSLSHFEIEGGCQRLESFPEEGLLPINLNSLRISRLSNLTSLDREGLHKLTSLQALEINCCNKLDSLPEHRLPSCLSSLSITDCSLLNPKLQNRKGEEWFKIAHIPSIHLDEISD
ncbi:putative disease resistance RPP13-like protein 1 [Durio zibethinus]|uniref:Disease resistance RPP13-like protein 1 n=1 Tax=Durio zibethinus TaxID=66656 RepID=A0A6P5Z502_DURZI|nr:putative disease resistance RPP13-like protein 1 [Durio zibethinus]